MERQTDEEPGRALLTGRVGRALSRTERALWLMDQAAPLNGLVAFHLRHAEELPLPLLQEALLGLAQRHPLLRMRITADGRRLQEEPPAPLPLRVLPRPDDRACIAAIEAELNQPLGPSPPLARAVLLLGARRSELLLVYHHLIADALSIVAQGGQLLTALAAQLRGEPPAALASAPLRPPLAALLPPSARGLGRWRAMRRFARCYGELWWRGLPHKLPLAACPPPPQRRMRVLHQTLSPEQTAALVARCRREGTTVQGALVAALLLAAARDVCTHGGQSGEQLLVLGCFSAVNLRPQLAPPPDPDELGLYVSQACTHHAIAPALASPGAAAEAALWPLARAAKAALSEKVAHGEPMLTLPSLGMFLPCGRDAGPRLLRRVDLAVPATVGLTNLGPIDLPQHFAGLTLERVHIAVNVALAVPLVLAANTFAGALACNVLYVEPLLTPARAAAIAAEIDALLQSA